MLKTVSPVLVLMVGTVPCHSQSASAQQAALVIPRENLAALLVLERQGSASRRSGRTPSRRKAIVVGASIGGAIGTGAGVLYCRADCGGGGQRGVLVFAPIGAAAGATAGLIMAHLQN